MKYSKIRIYKLYLVLTVSLIILGLSLINPLISVNYLKDILIYTGSQLTNLDIINNFREWGILCEGNFLFIIIPIFSALIIYLVHGENKIINMIRHKNRNSVWHTKVSLIIVSAFVVSFILVFGGYLISGLFIKGYNNLWTTNLGIPYSIFGDTDKWLNLQGLLVTHKVLVILWTKLFWGLSFIGLALCTLQLFMSNVFVYMFMVTLLVLERTRLISSFIILRMVTYPGIWANPKFFVLDDLFYLIGFITLFFIGSFINCKRDQGIGKKY